MSRYKKIHPIFISILIGVALLMGCSSVPFNPPEQNTEDAAVNIPSTAHTISSDNIPAYSGDPYVVIDDNEPHFSEKELSTSSYEYYSELDALGRCGEAHACIGVNLMPTEKRGKIGSVKPSGWHTVKYEGVDGNYLYNRCHLIAYQLSGENANDKNLITGTRYMNVEGMLPFENMVADYVKETGNHVMYRVTPVFAGDDLVASGVEMEAESVEDAGDGILFHVYCYNVQPGIDIDYATGDSALSDDAADANEEPEVSDEAASVMVWKSATGEKYHSINHCGNMDPDRATQLTEEQAINLGLEKCGRCW